MDKEQRKQRIVTHSIVEKTIRRWIVVNMAEHGIVVRAIYGNMWTGRHAGLAFASRVLQEVSWLESHERGQTPRILIDTARATNVEPQGGFICTTWQCFPDSIEICSVGTNTVLVGDANGMQEVLVRHSIDEAIKQDGIINDERQKAIRFHRFTTTHVLGGEKGCTIEDIRVVQIPLVQDTVIGILGDNVIASEAVRQKIPGSQLFSFIQDWTPIERVERTSVVISVA
ncbi:hypothetical protein [Tengunoibacter tsumagoiensis]|uniref:PPM-type phosphatase domain-containing protein n=1 Tax=Tengunoibacter tsumagoiensis TaxID=2014871 RepID=A0A401ZYT9_9CHLR|nr:hypothetical protein [Tengunoibacter tsumagoiensis]GCE12019.1 hypothetical protein KTT_18780 [Tengunoibacter tsumagoiensis]